MVRKRQSMTETGGQFLGLAKFKETSFVFIIAARAIDSHGHHVSRTGRFSGQAGLARKQAFHITSGSSLALLIRVTFLDAALKNHVSKHAWHAGMPMTLVASH